MCVFEHCYEKISYLHTLVSLHAVLELLVSVRFPLLGKSIHSIIDLCQLWCEICMVYHNPKGHVLLSYFSVVEFIYHTSEVGLLGKTRFMQACRSRLHRTQSIPEKGTPKCKQQSGHANR